VYSIAYHLSLPAARCKLTATLLKPHRPIIHHDPHLLGGEGVVVEADVVDGSRKIILGLTRLDEYYVARKSKT